MASERVQEYREMFKSLEEARAPWEDYWKKVVPFCLPERNMWANENQTGDVEKGAELYDTRAVSGVQILANGLIGYNVGPTLKWFKLRLIIDALNEIPGVKDWLEACEKIIYTVFHRSNFYDSVHEYYLDLASVGTATMIVEENVARFTINFDTRHPKETFLVPTEGDKIDSLYRQFWLTGRNALRRYEDTGNASETMIRDWEKGVSKKWRFLHIIHPREDRRIYSDLPIDKAIASVEISDNGEEILLEGGYDDMPALAARWSKNSAETYGRSPAMRAHPEAERANSEKKSMMEAGQRAVNPILQGPKGMLRKLRLAPFAYNTYKTPNERIYPLDTSGGYPFSRDILDQAHEAIDDHYLTDLFLMLQRAERQMTAREIIERQGEKVAALSGPLTRQNHEFLGPAVKRTFNIGLRAGWFPPIPEALLAVGVPIDVDFTGLLAQVQRRYQDANKIDHGLSQMGAIVEMSQKLDLWDNIDLDDLFRNIADTADFPQSSIAEIPDRDQIRAMRAKEIQRQKQLAEAQAMSEMMPNLGEAPEPGSPAEAVMSQVTGAAGAVARGG